MQMQDEATPVLTIGTIKLLRHDFLATGAQVTYVHRHKLNAKLWGRALTQTRSSHPLILVECGAN